MTLPAMLDNGAQFDRRKNYLGIKPGNEAFRVEKINPIVKSRIEPFVFGQGHNDWRERYVEITQKVPNNELLDVVTSGLAWKQGANALEPEAFLRVELKGLEVPQPAEMILLQTGKNRSDHGAIRGFDIWKDIPSRNSLSYVQKKKRAMEEKEEVRIHLFGNKALESTKFQSAVSDIIYGVFQDISFEVYHDGADQISVGKFTTGFDGYVSLLIQERIELLDQHRTLFLQSLMDDLFKALRSHDAIDGGFWQIGAEGDRVLLKLTGDMKKFFTDAP